MVQRGRPTSPASMLRRLNASSTAKERTLVVLDNLGGRTPVAEACRRLGVSAPLFRRQRLMVLRAALKTLEPRPRGRPAVALPPESRRLRELEEKLERLETDLAYAQVREELAILLPRMQRTEKKRGGLRAPRRAGTPSSSPSGGSAAATPGPASPGDSASAPDPSTPGVAAVSPGGP